MEMENPRPGKGARAFVSIGPDAKPSSTTLHANQAMKLRLAALKWEWRLAR